MHPPAEAEEHGVRVDGDDVQRGHAALEPGGQRAGTAAEVEDDGAVAAVGDQLHEVADDGEPLFAAGLPLLPLQFPAHRPALGRRRAQVLAHPVRIPGYEILNSR